jgi:hypothetical protein
MRDTLLVGAGSWLLPLPAAVWRREARRKAQRIATGLGWMTPDHHRVRDLAVLELARTVRPVSPGALAEALGLEMDHVARLLDDLERRLTFLFRDARGAVAWAYPLTADPTVHRLAFRTGERAYAA